MANKFDLTFYGNGKLLLSGEYFILDGALGLALPTRMGQWLKVRYSRSYTPIIEWIGKDEQGQIWLEGSFDPDYFVTDSKDPEMLMLKKIFLAIRERNPHFLRDRAKICIESCLEFPRNWGLGSSSTLIYTLSTWARVNPFEILELSFGGSGYDVACAQGIGPLLFKRGGQGPEWKVITFNPSFKEYLYFVYLGKKTSSSKAIEDYKTKGKPQPELIRQISDLTWTLAHTNELEEFEAGIKSHENILSAFLQRPRVKDELFKDYTYGEVKSLGAWGGDFALVTSRVSKEKLMSYFHQKMMTTVLSFEQMCSGVLYP